MPPGLAIGVAALFNTCIDSFKIIFAAQDFARDFEILDTRFQQQRLRLLLWGQSVGIVTRQGAKARPYLRELDADHIKPTILRSLGSINSLLEQFNVLERRYGLKDHTTAGLINVSGSRVAAFREMVKRNQSQKGPKALAKWAVFDAEQMRDAIEQLRSLIDGLVHITNELKDALEPDQGMSALFLCMANLSGSVNIMSQVRAVSAPSQQLLALDLHMSAETFHTAQELIDSIDTFITAPYTTDQSGTFFTTEEITSMSPAQSNSNNHDGIPAPSLASFTFSMPVRPARRDHNTMPSRDNVCPSTEHTYAKHFPTDQSIFITHQDEVVDGDMKLEMCIHLPALTTFLYLRLFYLTIKSLRERKFSFRRHGWTGREICRSGLSRGPDHKAARKEHHSSTSLFSRKLDRFQERTKTSYGSMQQLARNSVQSFRNSRRSFSSSRGSASSLSSTFSASSLEPYDDKEDIIERVEEVVAEQTSRKIIQLDFTNYARVVLQRSGRARAKRYTFSYWGHNYQWKRRIYLRQKPVSECYGHSFYLYREDLNDAIAQIEPILDAVVVNIGWVPPCELRFTDSKLLRGNHELSE
ncbi:uncharacterized protein N0V89_010136 [Didymosphaeria variabile]|uniref:Prion-inhibition and propagation HeLo domain-containing protein n=1 Tax=Didymosphaeria variabile TaxID=1932322 RepID=A0A9W8XGZ6_9PLEO|nr:uncharacterized protein N0V89_010136 [Didymosphaeria variabile]KAJ4348758.1 hypothetical protein N0V89_010136 [Didymosphaeria variabile]